MNGLVDKGYDVHVMMHNYIGQDIGPNQITLNDGTPVKFNISGTGREAYCKDLIIPQIREFKPDFFGILLDTFMIYPWYLDLDMAPSKTIIYFPSDGGRFPQGCENILRKCNLPVAMARYGQKQVKDLYGVNTLYIPHGVDSNMFKPVDDKTLLKAKFGFKDKFVVGMVGRNQGRKMHDRAIKAFAEFCKDKTDAVLLCHFDPNDGAAVFDIQSLIHYYGLQNRIFFTGTKYYKGFTYEQMNEIYNLFDVFLSATSGEGFGVPIIEAMSCEVPCVVTNYTTTEELIIENDAGFGATLVGSQNLKYFEMNAREYDLAVGNGSLTGSWGVERGLMDIQECAKQLDILYKEPALRKHFGINGRKAVLEKYDFQVVIDSWDKLLRDNL